MSHKNLVSKSDLLHIRVPHILHPVLTRIACLGFFGLLIVNQTASAVSPAMGSDLPAFSAVGTVLNEVYQQAGLSSPTYSLEESVCFSYSNGWWRVQVKYKNGALPGVSPLFLAGNITDCERIPGGVRTVTMRLPQKVKGDLWLPADAEPIAFPPPARNNLLICWLSLCPNPQLPFLNDTMMRQLVSTEFLRDPQNEGFYKLRYGPNNRFVSELCITNNGVIVVGHGRTMKLAPPFDRGHLGLEYRVLETTNWNGISFPLKSILRKYVAMPGATTPDQVYAATVTRFGIESFRLGIARPAIDLAQPTRLEKVWAEIVSGAPSPVQTLLPKPSSVHLVANDHRLVKTPVGEPTTYQVTGDQWLAATNAALVLPSTGSNTASGALPDARGDHAP